MTFYVLNAISPSMFNSSVFLSIKPIDLDTAKVLIHTNNFVSAIGHQSTSQLLSQLFNLEIPANRIAVQLKPNDTALIISLRFRPEEGRVYSLEELQEFLNQGRIAFYLVKVYDYKETIENTL